MNRSRTALITGAGSGIGLALARSLSGRGHAVHLLDFDGERLDAAEILLEQPSCVVGDVSDPMVFQALAEELGPVDILCLNAGVISTTVGAPWEASPDEWDRVLNVNLHGVVNGLRSFVPLMLASKRPCQILITASLAGVATWPGGGPYAASKHAVLAVGEQAAFALAETNITVTVLCPALVRSGMSNEGADPMDVAASALEAMDAGRFAVIPDEWAAAVEQRAAALASGVQPELPEQEVSGRH